MMFIMPTPPTISDTLATAPKRVVLTVVIMFSTLATSQLFNVVKSSAVPCRRRCRWRKSDCTSCSALFMRSAERAEIRIASTLLNVEPLTRFLIVV